ncbi:hypothetical protein E4U43_003358 [Claviceps pusilla]|uniref:Cell wall galactomannoprotein n=1 Tax=Claviceps pusilla TaxID=123648 RepID=A0A9P7NGY4_9HYPO|nr:hypothetical protein E4U43_003358 [Claviceps pusilla]
MKFANPILVLTAISGAYSLVVPRDGSNISDVLDGVQSAIDDLNNGVQSWTTDPTETLNASQKLVEQLKDGSHAVEESAPLNLMDALMLIGPLQTLKTHAQTLVDALKEKEKQIESQGLCDAVRGEIDEIDTGSKNLVHHTMAKIPYFMQGIGNVMAQPILDAIDSAKHAFSENNCVNHA